MTSQKAETSRKTRQFTESHRRKLSSAAKKHWCRGPATGQKAGLQQSWGKKLLQGPMHRRDNGLQPLPTDNYYLERDQQPLNQLPPLEYLPTRPYTLLWRVAVALQYAGDGGMVLNTLLDEVGNQDAKKIQNTISFLVNSRRHPIVRNDEGRYIWRQTLLMRYSTFAEGPL